MEIRRLTDAARAKGASARQEPTPPPKAQPGGAGGDHFQPRRARPETAEAPFWLVAMSTDRLARRRYQSEAERKAAAKLESAWVRSLAAAARPGVSAWAEALAGTPTLGDWQALATHLAEQAGAFEAPRAVWLPGLGTGRGQFLFGLEGNLLQLRPDAAGSLAEWTATVAHETFHHLQQELITALYRGEPARGAPFDQLAAYYRDARNVYETLGPQCPPARHRQQALEVGAWAYGEALALALPHRG